MREAAVKAIAFAAGKSRTDLDSDELLSLAMVRLIEVIGEAAPAVTDGTRARHPEVSWRAIAGTRDRLIHDYVDVNLDIVWAIVSQDLPTLVLQTDRIMTLEGVE